MGFRLKGLAWAILLFPVAANAQLTIDMNNITCGQYLAMPPSQSRSFSAWMSGYYNAAANSSVLNYDRLQKNSAKVLAYCKKNKSKTLPTAIKASAS